MAERHDQARPARRRNQIQRAGQFRRERQNLRGSARFLEELREELRGRGHNPLRRMHPAPRRADEGPLKMDSQNFRGEFAGGDIGWY